MSRKQDLLLRLLGIAGFVALLFVLPALGRSCGVSVPTPLPLTPGLDVTPSPPGPAPTHSPLPAPTTASSVSPLISPLPTPWTPTPLPSPTPTATPSVPVYTYRVVRAYPHDSQAWTQGLVYRQGVLYEAVEFARRDAFEAGFVHRQVHHAVGQHPVVELVGKLAGFYSRRINI